MSDIGVIDLFTAPGSLLAKQQKSLYHILLTFTNVLLPTLPINHRGGVLRRYRCASETIAVDRDIRQRIVNHPLQLGDTYWQGAN